MAQLKSMKPRFLLLGVMLCLIIGLVILVVTAPEHPVALLRVVDATGKPIAGATIVPEGLRTKDGPYRSGWYGWRPGPGSVTNAPVLSDDEGYARVPYPKFVFERIETGVLCLTVNHSNFVPDRPERSVAIALPAGAPLTSRVKDLWDRVCRRALIARPDPIVLQPGATLKISAIAGADTPADALIFAQVSGVDGSDSNSWTRPEPGVILTHRIAAGTHTLRAVMLATNERAWFSDVVSITVHANRTNEFSLPVRRGVAVRGKLDESVPRPVKNGRVVVNVWPPRVRPQENPPRWHAWSAVREDGSFVIQSLPEGELEIVALCDGFVSTNGPGLSRTRYPQKHFIGSNGVDLVIGMEPTVRLEVKVTDGSGQALADVRVATSPNVRYGEWASTILASDCYNSADFLLGKVEGKGRRPVLDFQGTSDANGLAVLPNLPNDVSQLSVQHTQYALPIVRADGKQHRRASFTLVAGRTNRISIQLEPKENSAITHY